MTSQRETLFQLSQQFQSISDAVHWQFSWLNYTHTIPFLHCLYTETMHSRKLRLKYVLSRSLKVRSLFRFRTFNIENFSHLSDKFNKACSISDTV